MEGLIKYLLQAEGESIDVTIKTNSFDKKDRDFVFNLANQIHDSGLAETTKIINTPTHKTIFFKQLVK